MVISVYLLKETREKSVISDKDAVLTSGREDSGAAAGVGALGGVVVLLGVGSASSSIGISFGHGLAAGF